MGGKVGHVEQRVVLAKLIEVQASEPIGLNNQMFRREVTVGRTRRPARQFAAPLLEASQKSTQEALAFGINFG